MEDASPSNFLKSNLLGAAPVLFVALLISLLPYAVYGAAVPGNVLQAFPSDQPIIVLLRMAFSFIILVAFSFICFSIRICVAHRECPGLPCLNTFL
jgi:amino acid permease